mmetsp:Transcript_21846/g.61356  ORF Transcript_21846/g.61356 Transcript_21846/m.61356 type:complete len:262 (-) Transcript_21846:623-1408(-)
MGETSPPARAAGGRSPGRGGLAPAPPFGPGYISSTPGQNTTSLGRPPPMGPAPRLSPSSSASVRTTATGSSTSFCSFSRSLLRALGYLSKSSCAANCAGLTKIETTTCSASLRAHLARSRWPGWRPPMVGTRARGTLGRSERCSREFSLPRSAGSELSLRYSAWAASPAVAAVPRGASELAAEGPSSSARGAAYVPVLIMRCIMAPVSLMDLSGCTSDGTAGIMPSLPGRWLAAMASPNAPLGGGSLLSPRWPPMSSPRPS